MTIRDCTHDDIPWLVETAAAAYDGLIEDFNRETAAVWARVCINSPTTIFLRGETHAICVYTTFLPWAPKHKVADLAYVFGPNNGSMEALQLFKAVNRMCQELGCDRFIIGSVYADLSPIARRLGGRKLNPLWGVEYRK